MKISLIKLYMLTALTLFLSACGSSSDKDDDSTSEGAYIQFYNGAASSALTYMKIVEGKSLGSAGYGDATSLVSLNSEDYKLAFYRNDSDGEEVLIDELDTTLTKGEKSLVLMTSDDTSTTLALHRFKREELSEQFRLFSSSAISGAVEYDIYLAEAGKPFTEAHKLETLAYQEFAELNSWQGETTDSYFSLGDYVVFLTLPGKTEPVYQSTNIGFDFTTEYVLVLRTTAGANSGNIELDVVANSSSVTSYPDVNETAQFRIYNSLSDGASLKVSLDGGSDNASELVVPAKSLTNFNDLAFGDYRLSAKNEADASIGFINRFVTFNQGESKAIVLYQNSEGKANVLSFNESTLPQVYDFQIQVANLVADYPSIDMYFIRSDETVDNAKYRVTSLEYAKNKSVTVPADSYQILVIVKQSDGELLIDRIDYMEFSANKNNIITVEADASSPTGYKINVLN